MKEYVQPTALHALVYNSFYKNLAAETGTKLQNVSNLEQAVDDESSFNDEFVYE